ncbi:MAG TPA: sortase [Candidatus Dormibacteraeota bacterium]|nr:sortase [Candidatus Dormibacteraeota bacterium]
MTAPPRLPRWLRRGSWVLIATAGVLATLVLTPLAYQGFQQHRLLADWVRLHPAPGIPSTGGPGSAVILASHPHLGDGQPIFRLGIPAIHFDAVVTEGIDGGILSSGPGHDHHTAYPGEGGLILVGNHNGFSTSWGDLHPGDEVDVDSGYGAYRYRIQDRSVVPGDDRSWIDRPRDRETLLLVTCWPLWQGALARERLVLAAAPVAGA